jgi:hypothetical protein
MTRTRFASVGAVLWGVSLLGCSQPAQDKDDVTAEHRAVTAVLFKPYVATATGSYAEAVAIGDLNGDGRNDVALTTSSYSDPTNDNMLHVFLQASDGTLLPRVRYPLGNRPESLDIGDVNGDGRADVVVGNFDSSTIGVLLQNASGTLDPMVAYPTVNSLSVKIGDFNSDGRMDVVGINWGTRDDGVDVFLQTASGALAAPVTYHVSHGGRDEVDVGDVDGDGRTDIIVMSGQLILPNVGVLPQNTDGTMGAPVYYSVGSNILTQGVGVGDVNGDGLQDIVVSYGGNRPGSFIGRFLQNAQHTMDPVVSYASYDIPTPVVLADVDSDGRKDVLVAHSGWKKLGVYRQTAAGDLGAEELYTITGASQYEPQGLAVGDINGDGLPDVVIADYLAGLVRLLHVDDAPPKVTLTAPTGGTYYPGVPVAIAWTASDNAGLAGFDVAASLDGGTTYAAIAGCTALPATATTCAWTPSGPTAGARLRITARDKAGNSAVADTVIDVATPTLTVTAPAAGTVFAGTSLAIQWTDNLPPSATVLVELSRDGGGSFETLAAAAPNTGTFSWAVAGPDTAQALVRLTASGSVTASGTSAAFGVVTAALAVTAPAPGATVYAGAPVAITWSDNLPVSALLTIELSRDGGASFEAVAIGVPNTGTFGWIASGPDAAAALVRITASGPVVVAGVGGAFGLVTPSVAVTGPAAGAVAYVGTTQTITWTDDLPAEATMLIELSRDGGASFETLSAAAPNTGSYAWVATGPGAASALVRVTWNDPLASRGLGAPFAIVSPTVTVTGPAAGATWPIGSSQTITWTSNVASGGTVRIELSRNGGSTFETLAAAASNTGSFTWTATGPAATAIARVTSNGPVSAAGVSGAFAIASPTLAVSAPLAGASWAVGSTQAIRWTTNLPGSGTVKLELSRNGGSSYTVLASAAPNSGSFAWTVAGSTTSSAIVRVSSISPAASATSGKFSIVAGKVTVTSPNTAVTWNVGTVHAVTWTHNGGAAATFKIEVSRDRGSTWSLVTAAAPATGATSGSYDWTVTSPRTTIARVRVTWTANTAATDQSDVSFKIN